MLVLIRDVVLVGGYVGGWPEKQKLRTVGSGSGKAWHIAGWKRIISQFEMEVESVFEI